MHIDFAPPSNGTYNNAGSSRQLANYLEHEDLERIEKGIYTEGFFNLTDDNIYKSKVIKDIDSNIGQLLKTDAKFFAIHVSPSENELREMGNTEQEQAKAMKCYIREVFIPEYTKNFNKGLSEVDIKFYGKIHFNRNRSDNKLNMHCHLIVSRKDQTNKKKLSPLTNHKSTKAGTVKGGFDRVHLFQQAEKGFDKLFNYTRQLTETFDLHNTMKNGVVSEQLNLQEQEFQSSKKQTEINQNNNQEKHFFINFANEKISNIAVNRNSYITIRPSYILENNKILNPSASFAPLEVEGNHERLIPKPKKKKKKGRRI